MRGVWFSITERVQDEIKVKNLVSAFMSHKVAFMFSYLDLFSLTLVKQEQETYVVVHIFHYQDPRIL